MKTYDAVIIGGGHNGLVAACYLAKAGYEVCVLERYGTVGGAAISEEIEGAPGHIASTGSYVLSLAPQKILNELDVWEHGVELIPRTPKSFSPLPDGESVVYWEDQAAAPEFAPSQRVRAARRLISERKRDHPTL